MMATQGNAVVDVQVALREENSGQDVMSLQVIPSTTTPAAKIAGPYGLGPHPTRPAASERLPGAAVHVVRVVLASVQPRDDPGLRSASLARPRTGRTVSVSVLACFIKGPAYLARKLMGPRIEKRRVDLVQDTLVLADGPDVFAEVLASLKVGAKSAARFGQHVRVAFLAGLAAEVSIRRESPTPAAIFSDHKCIIRGTASVTS
jgi:hypothetical protein